MFLLKKMMICCLACICATGLAVAQDTSFIQPKIMVIPRFKSSENMKDLYDSSSNLQVALSKTNEVLKYHRANLVTFTEKMAQEQQNRMADKASDHKEDLMTMMLQSSLADIYVEAKIEIVRHAERKANSVIVILEGYQKGTGNLLASKTGFSRIVQTDNIGFLTAQAVDTIAEVFLNIINSAYEDIRENGQSMFIEFSISNSSELSFNEELDESGELLSQVIRGAIKKMSVRGKYNLGAISNAKMTLTDVRLPLKNHLGDDYTGDDAYTDIYKFCKKLGIKISRGISSNNKVLITIL
jgi:hypothetical protein